MIFYLERRLSGRPRRFLTLILAADMGVNYFARENNPGTASY
jgi:hypothetical protein